MRRLACCAAALAAIALTASEARGQTTTCGGYVFAATETQLDRATDLVASGDNAAFTNYVESTPTVGILKQGVRVYVEEHGGFLNMSKVKLRPAGETFTFWTVMEAIEHPCKD